MILRKTSGGAPNQFYFSHCTEGRHPKLSYSFIGSMPHLYVGISPIRKPRRWGSSRLRRCGQDTRRPLRPPCLRNEYVSLVSSPDSLLQSSCCSPRPLCPLWRTNVSRLLSPSFDFNHLASGILAGQFSLKSSQPGISGSTRFANWASDSCQPR